MSNYIFIDYPKKKSNKHYDINRKKIKEYFKNDKNILSIYEYGKTEAPGVSDLDIIIIFKDTSKKINLNKKKYDFINIDKQLFDLIKFGNVIKMNNETFKSIQYFDEFKLNHLLGKKLKYIKPNRKELSIINKISISDWVPERILRLQNILRNKKIILLMLMCFKLIMLFVEIIKKIIGNNENINFVIRETKLLRLKWLQIKEPEIRLILLIKSAQDFKKVIYFTKKILKI